MSKAVARKLPDAVSQEILSDTSPAKTPQTRYSVYIFHHTAKNQNFMPPWEMKHTTTNMNNALKEAQALYDTQQYQKVEVKRQYIDPKSDRKFDDTLKTYDLRRESFSFILAKIGLAVLLCAIASLSAYGLMAEPF